MSWKLILVLLFVILLLLLFWLNKDNLVDVSLVFYAFSAVPIFFVICITFILGLVLGSLSTYFHYHKQQGHSQPEKNVVQEKKEKKIKKDKRIKKKKEAEKIPEDGGSASLLD